MKTLWIVLSILAALCLLAGLWWVLTKWVITRLYNDKPGALLSRLSVPASGCTESELHVQEKGQWKHYRTRCNKDGTTTTVYVDDKPPQ